MGLLSACGLGEAHLMLRRPNEISDGQRMRLKLAVGVSQNPLWLVIDEFSSSLDRTLAKVIAFNLRKLSSRLKIGVIVATTHEDVVEDLCPDVWVRMGVDGQVAVQRTNREDAACAGKKRDGGGQSVSPKSCGSVRGPDATGRISRGGIIGRSIWRM